MVFITKSGEETRRMGEILGRIIKKGSVIALTGDLGSGKTTFIKGMAKGLGIKNTVTSPTFLIIKKYEILKARTRVKNFYHIDCYRMENEEKLQELGIEEILKDETAVTAIEWSGMMKRLLPKNAVKIKFEWVSENERKIFVDVR